MPKRFNTDSQPHVVSYDQRAVMPGESHDFTAAQIKAGIPGSWSANDPREGLDAEKAFKKRRDAKASDEKETNPDPAESGEKES